MCFYQNIMNFIILKVSYSVKYHWFAKHSSFKMEESALEIQREMSYIFRIFTLRLIQGAPGGLLCLTNFHLH
jgi:hypothetical protein